MYINFSVWIAIILWYIIHGIHINLFHLAHLYVDCNYIVVCNIHDTYINTFTSAGSQPFGTWFLHPYVRYPSPLLTEWSCSVIFLKTTSLHINCTSMWYQGGVRDRSRVTTCGCGVISALKIHVSPQTKEVLDTFGTFQTELRGEVEMKVSLSACLPVSFRCCCCCFCWVFFVGIYSLSLSLSLSVCLSVCLSLPLSLSLSLSFPMFHLFSSLARTSC